MEFLYSHFFIKSLIASLFAGITCGIAGVWVYLLNIPFVGVAMAHTAFAGAVLGLLAGVNPVFSAAVFCLAAAFCIGPVAEKGSFSPNIATGILFSFMLGLAFIFMSKLRTNVSEALSLMWGNILTISVKDVYALAAVAALTAAFLVIFRKGIMSVVYSRGIALASGIPEKFIFYSLLALCALTVSINIRTTGALLIYGLITISPASAAQLTQRLASMYVLSAALASAACVSGLFASYFFDIPAGASIIAAASAIFVLSFMLNKKIFRSGV